MVQLRTSSEVYPSQFHALQQGVGAGAPGWLKEVREEALARFDAVGFPTPRHEDWKYTNVAPIARGTFLPAWERKPGYPPEEVAQSSGIHLISPDALVFLNGEFSPNLSQLPSLVDGARVMSLEQSLLQEEGLVKAHLARYAGYQENGFLALNTAFLRDGAFVYVPDGMALAAPIHLLFISVAEDGPLVSHPRILILLGQDSAATVIESYVGWGREPYFTNAVTEVALGPGARLDYYKLQREEIGAYHVGTTQVHQGRDARFSSFYLDVGSRLGRNDLKVQMAEEGGACTLNGLYITSEEQHIDNHTCVDHQASFTVSRQLYKGVLSGKSRAVFNGKVIARRGTHQVDAHQTNNNLLLSEHSQVDTKPQLEIFADDLKCSHGATVGQLDEEALFYFASRGVGRGDARLFLTYGFADQVISRAGPESMGPALGGLVRDAIQRKSAEATG